VGASLVKCSVLVRNTPEDRGLSRNRLFLAEIPALFTRLHRDEMGVTSVMSLVAVLMFTVLLVMLTNTVRHVDDKVRMQNAADAAAYSGGVVLASGMNAVVLANHLQSETLALVAFYRALEERGSSTARQTLPVLQFILGTPEPLAPLAGDNLLVNYQRDVVRILPTLAQDACNEIALRHGLPKGRVPGGRGPVRFSPGVDSGPRGPQWGVLWESSAVAVSREDQSNPLSRTLPLVDPNADGTDLLMVPEGSRWIGPATVQRRSVATQALRDWLTEWMNAKGRRDNALADEANRQLIHLLEVEYPTTNLPMMLRSPMPPQGDAANEILQQDFSFTGVVYRTFDREHGPKLFRNPLATTSDAITYAQVQLFLPRARYRCCPWVLEADQGDVLNTDPWPGDWDSFNQMWSAKLVPTDPVASLAILQSQPPAPANAARPLRLENVTPLDVERVNTH
jgi:hypothetical protein